MNEIIINKIEIQKSNETKVEKTVFIVIVIVLN